MSHAATVFNVMIATPGDVEEERKIIRETIHEWNAIQAKALQMVLIPVGWDSHAAPAMGDRPQEIINKQILRDCDLLVAVFWTRIGTDTGKAPSGTVEEIEEHLAAGKPAMLYFSNTPVRPDSVDPAQYEALTSFKNRCKNQGLIEEFSSPEEFRNKFSRQLQTIIRDRFQPNLPEPETLIDQLSVRSGLSEEAKTLLLAAAKADGIIINYRTSGGKAVQAGGKNLCRDNSPREGARWEGALNDLINAGLIRDRGNKGEVFGVTDIGYKMADQLKS